MEETMKLVEHPAQRGRAASTERLLWWLAVDLVVMLGIVVWYFAAGINKNRITLPSGITASADADVSSNTGDFAISTIEYGTSQSTPGN